MKKSVYAKRCGALYDALHENHILFVIFFLVLVVFRSGIVGLGRSGLAQAIALLVVESVAGLGELLVSVCMLAPTFTTIRQSCSNTNRSTTRRTIVSTT
jgi:hypothetical protein